MRKCQAVSIVVQKEDFLRPDAGQPKDANAWKAELRRLCGELKTFEGWFPNSYTHGMFGDEAEHWRKPPGFGLTLDAQFNFTFPGQPIRCIGYRKADGGYAAPRMRHKFLVFCFPDNDGAPMPLAVWTGSFNITKNAVASRENTMMLRPVSP